MERTGIRTLPRLGMLLIGIGTAVTLLGVAGGGSAGAATNPTSYTGNVTLCSEIGFGSSTQYNGSTTTSVDVTLLFTATVVNDRYVTVSNIAPGVVIQGAGIKAGNNYNVYSPIVADMRAPDNGGGQVPELSHWFLCYTYTPPTTTQAPTTVVVTTTPTTVVETTTPTTVVVTTTPTTVVETTTPTTVVETTTPTTIVETSAPTTAADTTTTEVGSEGPTTTIADTTTAPQQTTTTELASEGPTTTLLGSELPRTGSGDVSSSMVLLGLFLVTVGGVITALARRPLAG